MYIEMQLIGGADPATAINPQELHKAIHNAITLVPTKTDGVVDQAKYAQTIIDRCFTHDMFKVGGSTAVRLPNPDYVDAATTPDIAPLLPFERNVWVYCDVNPNVSYGSPTRAQTANWEEVTAPRQQPNVVDIGGNQPYPGYISTVRSEDISARVTNTGSTENPLYMYCDIILYDTMPTSNTVKKWKLLFAVYENYGNTKNYAYASRGWWYDVTKASPVKALAPNNTIYDKKQTTKPINGGTIHAIEIDVTQIAAGAYTPNYTICLSVSKNHIIAMAKAQTAVTTINYYSGYGIVAFKPIDGFWYHTGSKYPHFIYFSMMNNFLQYSPRFFGQLNGVTKDILSEVAAQQAALTLKVFNNGIVDIVQPGAFINYSVPDVKKVNSITLLPLGFNNMPSGVTDSMMVLGGNISDVCGIYKIPHNPLLKIFDEFVVNGITYENRTDKLEPNGTTTFSRSYPIPSGKVSNYVVWGDVSDVKLNTKYAVFKG
jgi:hypothetical protein